jgi:mRNA-degrading endonuclease RelE of RelBE toxin-antitoxin system
MRESDLRIGYFPSSESLSAPADRRRFVYYAKRRRLKFELANPRERYDLVVLNQRADLSTWSRYRPGDSRVIYEANDSYLSVPITDLKQLQRGLFKFVSGQSRYLQLNYRRAVAEMCRRADAVVCSTDEQRELIMPFCSNVHLILDFQDEDVTLIKTNHDNGPCFHFVWEGLASSGIPMALLREMLEPISSDREVALHIVTDLVYLRYSNLIGKVHTQDEVARRFGRFARHVYLYQWNPFALANLATSADMALIPIDMNNSFQRGKPENKLLLLWRMGVPTLTSATPAYKLAMQRAGLDMACAGIEDWRAKLANYMNDAVSRNRAGLKGRHAANHFYSSEEMMLRWDEVMVSLFGPDLRWPGRGATA